MGSAEYNVIVHEEQGVSETADFWRSDFGDAYIRRNASADLLKSKEWMFRKALSPLFTASPQRIIEFGANIGLNIDALRRIDAFSMCEYSAVEVNAAACEKLREKKVSTFEMSMLSEEREWGKGYDLALSVGVLIHVDPKDLSAAYDALYSASKRWIYLAEYHSPTPVEIKYRGHDGKLFKRDFAAEMLDSFPDLRVRDYGFCWRRDPNAPADDLVWTLLSREV